MVKELPNPCPFCIDGLQPAGIHPILGPVFLACMVCQGICPVCEGDGLIPADETCIGCFTYRLHIQGLAAWRCERCFGICDLIPIDRTEVFPHVHH